MCISLSLLALTLKEHFTRSSVSLMILNSGDVDPLKGQTLYSLTLTILVFLTAHKTQDLRKRQYSLFLVFTLTNAWHH